MSILCRDSYNWSPFLEATFHQSVNDIIDEITTYLENTMSMSNKQILDQNIAERKPIWEIAKCEF